MATLPHHQALHILTLSLSGQPRILVKGDNLINSIMLVFLLGFNQSDYYIYNNL